MGLTGVIYASIVVAWAAYLVPQALRRHDEVARKRSIERFSSAMRVLSRRGGSSRVGGRMVVTPPRSVDRVVTPSLKADGPVGDMAELVRTSRVAMRAAAARRRRVLLVLAIAAAGTGGLCALGYLPWWSVAIPLGLVLGFLFMARRQARAANESYWAEAAAARPQVSNVVRRAATRVDASHGNAKPHDPQDDEPTVWLSAEELRAVAAAGLAHDLAQERVVAVALSTADGGSLGGSLWDPLPVTLPTYVGAPVAKRTTRTIQLGEPGTWSSGHSDADSQTGAGAVEVEHTDEIGAEPRRAVNG